MGTRVEIVFRDAQHAARFAEVAEVCKTVDFVDPDIGYDHVIDFPILSARLVAEAVEATAETV